MQFSIITPSFRSSDWLKLCVASVADQGVEVEHIVQDSCSDDGTQDWLPHDPRVKAFVEKDSGMYDAINRGLRRAIGGIVAYLNADEQYLPGALASVGDCFKQHPEAEVVLGDVMVVDRNGGCLRLRQASVPSRYHTWVSDNLSVSSCGVFFRRSLIEKRGLFFDERYKDLGDVVWMLKLIEQRVPMRLLGAFTSVFTETGQNMGLGANVQRERAQLVATAPSWAHCVRPLIVLHYRLRRLLAGHYFQKPFRYSLYTLASPAVRVTMNAVQPLPAMRRKTQRN
ncbi:MAG: glycosyltransferase [Verrucomicrobia bacterium]|nr:glycosyltransferase [Verrucomicrobiota bacterium]